MVDFLDTNGLRLLWEKIKALVLGKADKVSGATAGDFAGLDSNGNLTDSGYSSNDFPHILSVEDVLELTSSELDSLNVGDVVIQVPDGLSTTQKTGYIVRDKYENQQQDAKSLRLVTVHVYNGGSAQGVNEVIYEGDYTDGWDTSNPIAKTYPIITRYSGSAPSGASIAIDRDVAYGFGTISSNLTITLNGYEAASSSNELHFWRLDFGIGSTVPDITWPQQITLWEGGSEPSLKANTNYTVTIFNNGWATCMSDDEQSVDVSGKADKVLNAISGNFAGLDSTGNLTDSGYKPSDFALNTHVTTKVVVSDIMQVPPRTLDNLQVGDIVVVDTDEGYETWIDERYQEYVVTHRNTYGESDTSSSDAGIEEQIYLTRVSNHIHEVEYSRMYGSYDPQDDFDWDAQVNDNRPIYLCHRPGTIVNGTASVGNNTITVFNQPLSSTTAFVLEDYPGGVGAIPYGPAPNYRWSFNTGNTVPNITWPSQILYWKGGSSPTIKPNTHYEITVVDWFAECHSTDNDTIGVSGKEDSSNKVSTIVGNETDTAKYPNTKAVYDFIKAFADANNLTMP